MPSSIKLELMELTDLLLTTRASSSQPRRDTQSWNVCLAVVEAVKHFQVYLSRAAFTIITNHSSLKYLARVKDENGHLARWSMTLQPYIFEVLHRPGVQNSNTDGMSQQSRPLDKPHQQSTPEEQGRNVAGPPET